MSKSEVIISLVLNNHNVVVNLHGNNNIFEIDGAEAIANGEAQYQIVEGQSYEYGITSGYFLTCPGIVTQSKVKQQNSGYISPNIYVGTLAIDIINATKEKCGVLQLEVQSVKASYRDDYRQMLRDITDKCTELLLNHNSPVSQFFETNFEANASTLYQRFAFIKAILDSEEFNDSVHKILSSPVLKWKESEAEKDIRSVRRINNAVVRQFSAASNRYALPNDNIWKATLSSIPRRIKIAHKIETVDTPENRFIKHALTSFFSLVAEFAMKVKDGSRLKKEAVLLENKLEQLLDHSIFKDISLPTTLPLNSPVLQRKEGYREILRVWLMFELAAKIVWRGGNDVYSGGKRDVAVLYEYWLFFKLLDIVKEVFKIEPKTLDQLIKKTADGLGLQLKQGTHIAVEGNYNAGTRKLNVQFSYNKTFSGVDTFPAAGSWTKSMRPDYTLSIWPSNIDSATAEKEELITHIHFDSKYKVDNITGIVGSDEDFETEKEDQRKGTFKRIDLLKMHSYKDAIRRTAGSYVLYPGTDSPYTKIGFHELIPGLGAFAIKPSKSNSGTEELKKFLNQVVEHLLNRTSQREKMSLKTYEIYKDKSSDQLNELLPEAYGSNRNFIADETFVLIAYYRNAQQLQWIKKFNLYNARTGSKGGSLHLSPKETGAKYLLLHSSGETNASRLFKLSEKGPVIFSKGDLIRKGYPYEPSQDFYLVYELVADVESEFEGVLWDITKLSGYKSLRQSPYPFAATISELMKTVVK